MPRSKMIIVKLTGGLGNQMFQYALGRRLAVAHNVPLKLDIAWYEHTASREYRLSHFNINGAIASLADIQQVIGDQRLLNKINRRFQRLKPYYRRAWIKERGWGFDPNLLRAPADVYLLGYWQSRSYVEGIEELLRHEFKIISEPDAISADIARAIASVNSVSLHVRRGDYVTNPSINQLHGVCSLDYYHQAVAKVARTISEPHFFIFSDDPDWTRQNLHLLYPTTYVTHNGPERDYEDLRLMSLCRHHIIANSSFSWWGAWLSRHPGKVVIAPQKWSNLPQVDNSDLIPAGWHRI